MKKKLVFALFTALIVVALLCCACAKQEPSVLDYCDIISDAKSATQVITVKSGSDELAKETLNYNFVTGKVSIERKTLNSSDADELYSIKTEIKDIAGKATVKLTKDMLRDVTETDTTLKATVLNAKLNEMFGIQASDVQGNANLELVAKNEHIVSITVSYTSTNGNAIQIVTNYVY